MKKLILIDGNSIMFRAYYATAYPGAKLMQSSKGTYTNAVFAFVGMFEKIIDKNTEFALVAFDTKEKTKRHLQYEEYKAGRVKMPEELAEQIPLIYEYIELSGVKLYFKPGYEADDIIGTLAKRAKNDGYLVEVYSSDKDLLQLVDENITVNLLKKGMKEVATYTPKSLFDEYQLNHHQMIDLKSLMGDQSDNIPGVPGVGEKTAIKLLQEYHSLENILENKDEIKGKLGEKIKEHEDLAKLSKSLVTIDIDADIDISLNDVKKLNVKEDKLASFFQSLDLHVFVKKMDSSNKTKEDLTYQVIDSERELNKILKNNLSIHFELDDYNYHKANLWGIGLSDGINHYFIDSDFALNSLSFQMYLNDNSLKKYTYDYKASRVFLLWNKLDFLGVNFD